MEIVSKITLVASIVLVGYNASQLFACYETVCKKADDFREMARQSETNEPTLRRSNFLLSLFITLAYVLLVSFSGLAHWVTAVVAVKLCLTLLFSDKELCMVVRGSGFEKRWYWIDKVDSLFNLLFGLAVALILVL